MDIVKKWGLTEPTDSGRAPSKYFFTFQNLKQVVRIEVIMKIKHMPFFLNAHTVLRLLLHLHRDLSFLGQLQYFYLDTRGSRKAIPSVPQTTKFFIPHGLGFPRTYYCLALMFPVKGIICSSIDSSLVSVSCRHWFRTASKMGLTLKNLSLQVGGLSRLFTKCKWLLRLKNLSRVILSKNKLNPISWFYAILTLGKRSVPMAM